MSVDWLILPYYAKKLTCDERFILIREYTRKYVDLSTSFQSTHADRYVSVRYGLSGKLAKLNTDISLMRTSRSQLPGIGHSLAFWTPSYWFALLFTYKHFISVSCSLSSHLPTGQLSNVPWRRTGVKYANNEVSEHLCCIIAYRREDGCETH
jgi:hypothetical protein